MCEYCVKLLAYKNISTVLFICGSASCCMFGHLKIIAVAVYITFNLFSPILNLSVDFFIPRHGCHHWGAIPPLRKG